MSVSAPQIMTVSDFIATAACVTTQSWSDTHWALMTDLHLNRADIHGMRKMLLKELNVITIHQPISTFNVLYSGDDRMQRSFQMKWNWSVTQDCIQLSQHHPDQRNKTLMWHLITYWGNCTLSETLLQCFQTWTGRLYDYYLYLITVCFKLTRKTITGNSHQIHHALWWQKVCESLLRSSELRTVVS